MADYTILCVGQELHSECFHTAHFTLQMQYSVKFYIDLHSVTSNTTIARGQTSPSFPHFLGLSFLKVKKKQKTENIVLVQKSLSGPGFLVAESTQAERYVINAHLVP